jgi:hypothetical protein
MMIFDRDNLQGAMNTEETALIVIFVFVVVSYGSIIMWGYVSKIIIAVLYLINSDFANKLFDFISVFSPEEENVDINFSWLLPDFWHHQIGILSLLAFLTVVLGFQLLRLLGAVSAFVAVWLWQRKHNAKFWTWNWRWKKSAPAVSPNPTMTGAVPHEHAQRPPQTPVRERTVAVGAQPQDSPVIHHRQAAPAFAPADDHYAEPAPARPTRLTRSRTAAPSREDPDPMGPAYHHDFDVTHHHSAFHVPQPRRSATVVAPERAAATPATPSFGMALRARRSSGRTSSSRPL